jgi:CheY-like chemotaxis protein
MTARPLSVLVADDDESVRQIIGETLTRDGCRVDVAVDGGDALRQALAVKYDVLLIDLVMPEHEGLEAIHRIRQALRSINPDMRMVAMSGVFGPEMLHTATLFGANLAFQKPLTRKQLTIAVFGCDCPDKELCKTRRACGAADCRFA